MAFILKSKNKPLVWPVTLYVPEDGGEINEHLVNLHFNHIPRNQYNELTNQIAVRASKINNGMLLDDEDVGTPIDDVEIAARLVCGWDATGANAMLTETGEPVPFTEENKALFLNSEGVAMCVIRAYGKATSGEAKRGNSKAPRGIG